MKKYEVTDLAALVELGNWRQVGSGQLAASVDKEASKRLVKNGRFAGRNGALIDLQAGRGWLVDMTENDRQFSQGCPVISQEKVKKLLGLAVDLEGLSKFGPWTVDHAGHAWAKAGSRYAVITWGDGQEVKSSMQDKKEGLKKGTLQTFDQVMALTQPPKPTVKQGDFKRLYDWLYKHGMSKYQRLATEYNKLSEDTLSDFYTDANAFQRERGDLLTSDREVIAYMMALYGIDPAKQAIKEAAKSVKDTGFAMITLDHKDLAAPAKNVKKAVKALTEPAKKPATKKKSKSRIKLEKAQEDAQTMQISAVEFVTFCARINSGRKKPYSTKNCELIFTQTNGHATDVRGFKSWIKAGRAVKKDQKSIVIEAPRFVYDEQGQPVLDKHGKPKMYAVPCCVFDIAQTEELKESKEA